MVEKVSYMEKDICKLSERQSDLLESLNSSKVFIYKIRGIKYYIGRGIFEIADDNNGLYESFIDEIDRIHSLGCCPEKSDTNMLVSIFDKIMDRDNKATYENKDYEMVRNSIADFISDLQDADIGDILKQKANYKEVIDYKDEAHYRHDPKRNEETACES